MVKGLFGRVKKKGYRYWTSAFVIFLLTISGSSFVYDFLHLRDARSYFFQHLLDWGPRPVEPRFVRLALIGNDDYWQGYLAGRRPIKRDYLAQLVDKLVSINVHVIALDFDARLPNPASFEIPAQYQKETDVLIRAIKNAARQGKKIVLATPISLDGQGRYHRDSDIYQAHGLCINEHNEKPVEKTASAAADQTIKKNITCGYIALPYDPLVIPARLLMDDGSFLDSFALAVARAEQPDLINRLLARMGNNARYSNFISEEKFRRLNATVSAHALLQEIASKENLEAKAIIVGADWSRDAVNRGPRVDLHSTPVGPINGAMLHANFVEALLDSRIFGAAPESVLRATEILFSLIAAIAFALISNFWPKVCGIFLLLLILFFIQWSLLHSFGVFFDAFVPVVGLGLHSLYEWLWPLQRGKQKLSVD
jgi:CHASE2 domain-containing sensor protein